MVKPVYPLQLCCRGYNDNGSFTFYINFISVLYHCGCLVINKNCLPFVITCLAGSMLLIYLVFCGVFFALSCVVCTQCLWIFHSWLHLRFSLTFIRFLWQYKLSIYQVYIWINTQNLNHYHWLQPWYQ